MEEQGFIYEDEELNEIEYYELISFDEIIKLDPTFIAFSQEEIYNYFLNFLKSKTKTEGFLNLFNDIIQRQKGYLNTNNFIIIPNAKRNDFTQLFEEDFVNKIKSFNKEQFNFAFKNKNNIWFPLIYDIDNSSLIFSPKNTTILELNKNDNYIIFKDDERNIPVLALYFYEPLLTSKTDLNEKIVNFLINDRFKGDVLSKGNFKSIDEMIKNYKIKLPLDKIDQDEFDYSNLNKLLNRFNYDLDYIDKENYDILKNYLESIIKNETDYKINYNKIKIEPLNLTNNRFLFFNIIKSFIKLLDITHKSSKEIANRIKDFNDEKEIFSPITNNLEELILNINDGNYNDVIKNLKNIRKNISINNFISLFNSNFDIKLIDKHLDILINKFTLFKNTYKDLFHIFFDFKDEEYEIKKGLDTKDYEGIPLRIDEFKKNATFIEEDDDIINDEIEIIDDNIFFKKYYHNSRYNLEKGFIEVLKKICPSLKKMSELSKLPINFDIIIEDLFKNFSGKVQDKFSIIKSFYNDKFDDNYYKEQAKKTEKFVLNTDDEDIELINAFQHYISIIIDMFFDVICKWSIDIQINILNGTLMFDRSRCYIPCINDIWNDYGMPYDMDTKDKDGVLPYLICIFEEVFKEDFSENDENYLPFPTDFKKKIIQRIKDLYSNDLKSFQTGDKKKKKDTKGLEAQKNLVEFFDEKKFPLKYKDYKNKGDKFFDNFIEALIYMPSVRYEKIHKYLLGCCLEKIDDNFSADIFLKTNRKDLDKAKSVFATERVVNKKRYLRLFFSKIIPPNPNISIFKGIDYNFDTYFIYESSLDEWFNNLSDKTIISKKFKNDIQLKLRDTYNIHLINYLKNFFNKKEIPKDFTFSNYKQILNTISIILFNHLKFDAFPFISQINETIKELDNLSSIINDDNNIFIYQIRTIFIIRAMCLPSYPDISINSKLIPIIKIDNDISKKITNDISIKIFKIINDFNMPTLEDQINYINKIREENKDKILSNLNKKTREERDIIKEMKKIGLGIDDGDDDLQPIITNKPNDNAEDDFNLKGDNTFEYDEDLEVENFGFIYSRYSSRD